MKRKCSSTKKFCFNELNGVGEEEVSDAAVYVYLYHNSWCRELSWRCEVDFCVCDWDLCVDESAILVVLPEKEGEYECIGSKWGLRCKRLVCVCYEYHLRDGEVIYNR